MRKIPVLFHQRFGVLPLDESLPRSRTGKLLGRGRLVNSAVARCIGDVVKGVTAFIVLLVGGLPAYAADTCNYDEKALLGLDENAFDQDVRGGWRAVTKIPGCELGAADLLAAYRARYPLASSTLSWHEGQLRASAGQYERAIPLLEGARKPADQGVAGWNYYVDATVAFLRYDRPGLLAARNRLASVAYPQAAGMPPLRDGYLEVPTQPGQPPAKVRWPPNIDVVEGLVACFDKPYSQAYGAVCRSPNP